MTDGHMQVVLFRDTQTMWDVFCLVVSNEKKVICEVECTLERIHSIYHLTINIVFWQYLKYNARLQHIYLFIFNK